VDMVSYSAIFCAGARHPKIRIMDNTRIVFKTDNRSSMGCE